MSSIEEGDALVIATFSREMDLRLANGRVVRGRVKGRKIRPVCGDHVTAHALDDEPEWLIKEILPRKNCLTRPDSRGKTEILAANISFLAVVTASSPTADWYIVDRYLAAAEIMAIPALVVFNKSDLADDEKQSRSILRNFETIGYKTILCSAKTGENVEQLNTSLTDQVAIIVGQSGVGKSSLINRLVVGAELRVGTLSSTSSEGKHTTVNSMMLDLPQGGAVIDSPGVRDYAPVINKPEDVARGFREINEAGQMCRFANCRHLREPDCAVKQAVADDEISPRRYESFKRLMSMARESAERSH